MVLPFKIFYSLDEIVEHKWRDFQSVDEIMHSAAVGLIPIHIPVDDSFCYQATYAKHVETTANDLEKCLKGDGNLGNILSYAENLVSDYKQFVAEVPSQTLAKMLFSRSKGITAEYLYALTEDGDVNKEAIFSINLQESAVPLPITLNVKDFIILIDSIKSFEEQYPDGDETEPHASKNYFLLAQLSNAEHPWYSKELSIAVKAWIALYANHEGHRNDNQFKPHGGHKEMIVEWLKDNHGNATNPTSRERIASVVSPCDLPGPAGCPKWNKK